MATNNLANIIDSVNDAFFWNRDIAKNERLAIARQIADRQGQRGAYADTFALFDHERRDGIRLFTGEPTKSAAARHIAGEEACRALRLLNVRDKHVVAALDRATEGLLKCLGGSERSKTTHRFGRSPGAFCCGRCSVSLWRHVTAGGLDRHEQRLDSGLRLLRTYRSGDGDWRIFPFWYTVSALVEMDTRQAIAELKYAAPLLESSLRRTASDNVFARRRHDLARRALVRVR